MEAPVIWPILSYPHDSVWCESDHGQKRSVIPAMETDPVAAHDYCVSHLNCFNEVRTLKVAHIPAIKPLTQESSRPDGSSLARYVHGAFGDSVIRTCKTPIRKERLQIKPAELNT